MMTLESTGDIYLTQMSEDFNPQRRTIKNNNIFLVTDPNGNVLKQNASGYGLYTYDTRFLNRLELKINSTTPVVLSSSTESGHSSVIICTNIGMKSHDEPNKFIAQETVQIKREGIIYGAYFETITVSNYNNFNINLKVDLYFDADFADIFQVRGWSVDNQGTKEKLITQDNILKFIYKEPPKTGATLSTDIGFIETPPSEINFLEEGRVSFVFSLESLEEKEIKFKINLKSSAAPSEVISAYDFDEAYEKAIKSDKEWNNVTTGFLVNNEDFNEMISRGSKDIKMLITKAQYGDYIAAGIPWFVTLFGRDCLIAARQSLMLNPNIAKNVLLTLSKFQGKVDNPWKDEEPGKIPHEIRFGEMARSGQVPHETYYGTVDATPLWLMLYYDYFKWTDDKETIEKLWPTALACFEWIDKYSPKVKGYVAYLRRSSEGLENQYWKDSYNSNIHSDGSHAAPPIAPVEVQGYVYAAKFRVAEIAGYLGNQAMKAKLLQESWALKQRFHEDFWIEDKQFYAMGLDKDGRKMEIITTNPGHCLETGIIDEKYIDIVANRFFAPDMFTGWGIRTLSEDTPLYNPMSYHNGSIWPHDNSLIAYGLAKAGKIDLALRIATGMFESARLMSYKRLPELFCGFPRKYNRQDPPVMYPVACIPQAWAAGSIFMLMQAFLNLIPDAQKREITLNNSLLPSWSEYLKLTNLKVGQAYIDIEFRKTNKSIVIDILDKRGKVDIIIRK
ncbi:MAG: amylo-alpha-1,6-glucosidase [bacterium]